MMIRCLSTIVFTAALVWAPSLSAQQSQATDVASGNVSRVTTEISNEVYSPFCPGKTLAMCPSPAAAEVRRDIQKMAEEGVAKEEIKTRIIEEYGDEFKLEEPPLTDNLGLLGMIAFGLFLAFLAVWVISRRSARELSDAAKSQPSPDDDPMSGGDSDDTDSDYRDELRGEYRA